MPLEGIALVGKKMLLKIVFKQDPEKLYILRIIS